MATKLSKMLCATPLVFLGVLSGPNVVHGASQPTETNAGICNELHAPDITPALYGLCVAYCEALDCDETSSISTNTCQTAGSRILAEYNAQRLDTDPMIPCVSTVCPCWSADEISAIGVTWYPNTVDLFPNDFSPYYSTIALLETRSTTPYSAYQYVNVYDWSDTPDECVYAYYDAAPDGTYTVRSQQISSAEFAICKAQIEEQYAALLDLGVPVNCTGNLCPYTLP